MKFSLDGLKKTNWKQLAVDHGEKVGLAVAVLVAVVILYSGLSKGTYTDKNPSGVLADLDEQRRALARSSWTPDRRAEDLPTFDVNAAANEVTQKMNAGNYAWPKDISGPVYPIQEKGSEPTWLPPEDVLADYVALPVKLVPEDQLNSADGESDPLGEDEEEPGEFDLDATTSGGGSMFDFGSGFSGSSPEESGMSESGYPDGGSSESGYPMESPRGSFSGSGMFGEEGMEGAGYAAPESNARGKGVKMVAVRSVFPYRRQVQEMARSMNVTFPEAKARLEFLDMQVERQRASAGANPWSEDWEPVNRDAAVELLTEDLLGATGQPVEIVSPALIHESLTMPLPTPAYGTWESRTGATHPRVKEFDITQESPELRERIEEMLREEAVIQEEQAAAVGPQRNRFLPERQRSFDRRRAMDAIVEREQKEGEPTDPVLAAIKRMSAADVLLLTRFFDVDVEPGQAYRYRVRVQIANPNFGLGAADVSDPSALEGETRWTPWSDPSAVVSIPPDELAYLTTMYPKSDDALPEARLEVTEYSREYGTLVAKDTRVDAGDLLVFEERNTYTLDPFKKQKDEKATYPFVTEHVVIGVDALPDDAAAFHPDLNLGNRSLPPGRVLLLLDTGSVREIDAGLELQRQAVAKSVQREREGLGPQMTDVNAPKPDPSSEFGESGGSYFRGMSD